MSLFRHKNCTISSVHIIYSNYYPVADLFSYNLVSSRLIANILIEGYDQTVNSNLAKMIDTRMHFMRVIEIPLNLFA